MGTVALVRMPFPAEASDRAIKQQQQHESKKNKTRIQNSITANKVSEIALHFVQESHNVLILCVHCIMIY